MRILLAATILGLFATVASADSVWTYTGNASSIDACDCALTGTVILDPAFNVVSYSFTAGALTLDSSNSTGVIDPFSSFGMTQNGPFFTWRIILTGATSRIYSDFYGSIGDATDSSSNGLFVTGNRGSWADPPVETPEPGSLLLLGAGLAISAIGNLRLKRLGVKPQITGLKRRLHSTS